MQFYNTTDEEKSLVHECWALCGADDNSYPLDGDVTRRMNIALERVIGWILEADGTWQWDDSNHTDLPIGTQTLVNSQGTYTFNDKFLEIQLVEVKDDNGDFHILQPIDQKEYSSIQSLREAFETDGLPEYYDKISEDTIELFPAPDNGVSVTLSGGLRVKFSRTADLFAPNDTTQEPGFASPYHSILSYMAALPFCSTSKTLQDRVSFLREEIERMKQELITHYSKREQDKRTQITFKQRAYK